MKLNIFSLDALNEYANELLNNGYSVIYDSEVKRPYFTFYKNGFFGHCTIANSHDTTGFNFSTQHKPCRECGTGFGMFEGRIYDLQVKHAEACLINYPRWAKRKEIEAVKKWASIDEYINNNWRKEFLKVLPPNAFNVKNTKTGEYYISMTEKQTATSQDKNQAFIFSALPYAEQVITALLKYDPANSYEIVTADN